MSIKIKGATVIDTVGSSIKGTFKHATTHEIDEVSSLPLAGEIGEAYYLAYTSKLAVWNGSSWSDI